MNEEYKDIINHCAATNTPEFNFNKVIEEIAEFQEVMAKIRTKASSNPAKPKREELVKEYGDLLYRGMIYLKGEFPELTLEEVVGKVQKRIDKKLTDLAEWHKENLYKGGL